MKLPLKIALAAGVISLAGAGLVAHAQHHGGGHGDRMKAADLDGDGQVTRAEVESLRAENFAKADANGDGSVTQDEMTAFREAQMEERKANRQSRQFERADANNDGVLSADEFGARMTERFDKVDTDGDGIISDAEREAARENMRGWRAKRGGDRSQ